MHPRAHSTVSVAILFALVSLPLFLIGGLAGIPLAFNSTDLYVHDTYYVIGHWRYGLGLGIGCALFAAIYYWFPKATGRMLSQRLAQAHFWLSLIFALGIFLPTVLLGRTGMHRRWYQGSADSRQWIWVASQWNTFMSVSACLLAATQLIFIFNCLRSFFKVPKVP